MNQIISEGIVNNILIMKESLTIQIIKEKCNQCLLCVRDCVSGAWKSNNNEPVMAAPELCNRCGHCVAVCPQSAIYHEALDYQQITKINTALLNPDGYRQIVQERRSIRQYKSKAVPQDLIENILKMASYSPTASNRQNVAYTVITDNSTLKYLSESVFGIGKSLYEKSRKGIGKIFYFILKAFSPDNVDRYLDPMDFYIKEADKGRDYILHGAPVLILVRGSKKEIFINENCNIAAANIMNYAHTCGLGTCYIGFLTLALKFSPALRKKAGIPKDQKAYAALILGYPAYRYSYTTSRKQPDIRWINS